MEPDCVFAEIENRGCINENTGQIFVKNYKPISLEPGNTLSIVVGDNVYMDTLGQYDPLTGIVSVSKRDTTRLSRFLVVLDIRVNALFSEVPVWLSAEKVMVGIWDAKLDESTTVLIQKPDNILLKDYRTLLPKTGEYVIPYMDIRYSDILELPHDGGFAITAGYEEAEGWTYLRQIQDLSLSVRDISEDGA